MQIRSIKISQTFSTDLVPKELISGSRGYNFLKLGYKQKICGRLVAINHGRARDQKYISYFMIPVYVYVCAYRMS